MAHRLASQQLEVDGTNTTQSGYSVADFLESYKQQLDSMKASAQATINSAYESLLSNTLSQKDTISAQADSSFRDIYANAKAQSLNQSEQLAALGLDKGSASSPSSGYGETSRVRQEVALQNNLTSAANTRDTNLAAVDTTAANIKAEQAQQLASLNQQYDSYYLNALTQANEQEYNYYIWQQEFEYQKAQDAQDQSNWQAQFDYQKSQDAQDQSNWQAQFDYQKAQDAQDQSNWQAQFDYQKSQDAQDQSNWQAKFDYQKSQDAQDQSNWQAEFDYQKAQDAQEQSNWAAEYLLKKSTAAAKSSSSGSSSSASDDTAASGSADSGSKAAGSTASNTSDLASQQKFEKYLTFAQSAASFPDNESYAKFFAALYRQSEITLSQFEEALRKRGISETAIKAQVKLL